MASDTSGKVRTTASWRVSASREIAESIAGEMR
jgi:hypothetical protein